MAATSHLISPKIPGYGPYDGRCLPCSGIFGAGAFNISSCSSLRDYKTLPKFKILPLRCVSRGGALSVCYAYSGGQERNSDFSRDKQPYFRNRKNRQNEESDDSDSDSEEDDILPSKNGPLLSGSAKRSTTEIPGERQGEICELFKQVMVKLSERADLKNEKMVEDTKVESKQTEAVNSLVNLLRQHNQGKQNKYNGTSSDINSNQHKDNGQVLNGKTKILDGPILNGRAKTPSVPNNRVKNLAKELLDQPEQDRLLPDDNAWAFLGSKDMVKPAAQKIEVESFKRPVSNFQRISPVPQVKYDPINSRVVMNDGFAPSINSNEKKKKKKKIMFEPKPKAKPVPVSEPEPEPELETELFLDDEASIGKLLDEEAFEKEEILSRDMDDDDEEEEEDDEQVDLSGMKLTELRALAKSRGMKGFTKLKKQELIELLAGCGSL